MKPISPLVWLRLARKPWRASPPLLLAIGFLLLILIGGLLLKLPLAHRGEMGWLDAFFTATSAVCITGLTTLDISTQLTPFGQWVLMLLMQLGGLGIMTFAALTLLLLGGRLGLGYQRLVSDAMNQTQPRDLLWLLRRICVFVLVAEAIGMGLLALQWVPEFGWGQGLYLSLFHSISAFNNAGFTLWPDSLQGSHDNTLVILVFSLLIIAGGLGFTVVSDCWEQRRWRCLSLHSKLTLVGTGALLVAGFLLLSCIEWNNPGTLGELSLKGKLLGGWFQSVSPRTAGFSSFDLSQLRPASVVVVILLMFVGAGTNSTGGGIKVSTMMVLLLTTRSFLAGRSTPVVFGRSIGFDTIFKALAVSFLTLMLIVCGVFLLTLTDPSLPFLAELAEVVSAVSTTGLTLGLTPHLSDAGQLVLIPLMFIGRLGPLTLAFLLTQQQPSRVSYAEGEVHIG